MTIVALSAASQIVITVGFGPIAVYTHLGRSRSASARRRATGGSVLARMLFGDIHSSGRLVETFPIALADVPGHPPLGA